MQLAASIKQHGLIQPLVVTPVDGGDGYLLIAGERRWRAAKQAGLSEVPVVVRKADRREMLALAIVENVQRADLDPIEAAEAYRQLMDEFGLTQNEVADIVGKSRVAVANAVRLLKLAPLVRQLLTDGHLSEGHARALLGLADAEEQLAQARLAIAHGRTVREVQEEEPPAHRARCRWTQACRARAGRQNGRIDPARAHRRTALTRICAMRWPSWKRSWARAWSCGAGERGASWLSTSSRTRSCPACTIGWSPRSRPAARLRC